MPKAQFSSWAMLEYLALWEGQLTGARLAELVGSSREHAQRAVIGPYRTTHPKALPSRGGVMDPETGSMGYFPSDPAGALCVLSAVKVLHQHWPLGGAFESVPLMCRENADNTAFVALYRAMCAEHAINVQYRSKRRLSTIEFSPHTLVDAGARAHFRGWAKERRTFIDLVPNRVARVDHVTDQYVSNATDTLWHERTHMIFSLISENPTLQEALSLEYALDPKANTLTIFCVRAALAGYVQRHFEGLRMEGYEGPVFALSSA